MSNIILLCVLTFIAGVVVTFIGVVLLLFWSYQDE